LSAESTDRNGKQLGFGEAYRNFTLLDPPRQAWLWLASILGWLVVPAIIGGFAGQVITARIESTKGLPANKMFLHRTLAERLRPPTQIDWLGGLATKTLADRFFVDVFVRMAHRSDWRLAQKHWEILIRDTLRTAELTDLDRHESMKQAQDRCRIDAIMAGLHGQCIVCHAHI